jgi:uncharacterized membrane protein YhiD involved in acid resistance
MPEWLQEPFPNGLEMPLRDLLFRLVASLILGCVVAGIYRLSRRRPANGSSSIMPTLVLLTVLICMVTLVIGDSVARAFSLVGALAIVRFRTVVEDTRDTAFVIFSVGVGMALGAGFLRVPLVAIPIAAVAALLFRPARFTPIPASTIRLLTVRVGAGHDPEVLLRKLFDEHLEHWELTAAVTARQGAAVDLTYAVRLRRESAAVSLVASLNSLEGVQSVELRHD